MPNLLCYICRSEFVDNDLTVPTNINVLLPFGHVNVVVFTHYMCGLDHFLKDIGNIEELREEDRIKIETRLMVAINEIREKGTIQ